MSVNWKGKYPVTFYGFAEDNDVVAKNVTKNTNGSQFDVEINGELFGHFEIPSFGTHNILNSLAILTFCRLEGLEKDKVAAQLKTFSGVKRRFSEKYISDMVVIDDYAHHPSEIRATLDASRQNTLKRKSLRFSNRIPSRARLLCLVSSPRR